jgi:uncharacterized protein YmfQ (DUF2313 family)
MTIFARRDLERYADSLAAYLPGGALFQSRSIQNSNFRKLLRGLAGELFRSNGLLKSYSEEIIPDLTNKFLDEWESALGIPDNCFTGTGTNDERRRDILTKLAALGVQTAEDFEALALVFGKEVTVKQLSTEALPPYDVPFTVASLPGSRFVIVVEGENIATNTPPYDVPFLVFDSESLLECVFKRLKPANCAIIFRNIN